MLGGLEYTFACSHQDFSLKSEERDETVEKTDNFVVQFFKWLASFFCCSASPEVPLAARVQASPQRKAEPRQSQRVPGLPQHEAEPPSMEQLQPLCEKQSGLAEKLADVRARTDENIRVTALDETPESDLPGLSEERKALILEVVSIEREMAGVQEEINKLKSPDAIDLGNGFVFEFSRQPEVVPIEGNNFEHVLLSPSTVQFEVGSADEPRLTMGGEPIIGAVIKNKNLKPVGETGVKALREIPEKLSSGFADMDVIGLDGQFFDHKGKVEKSLQLIADWAGASSIEEAFGDFNVSSPVAVFQVMMKEHFDPLSQKEEENMIPFLIKHDLMLLPPERKPTLTLLPKENGVNRFIVETPMVLGKVAYSEEGQPINTPVQSYRVRQEVEIRRGDYAWNPAEVTIGRTAERV